MRCAAGAQNLNAVGSVMRRCQHSIWINPILFSVPTIFYAPARPVGFRFISGRVVVARHVLCWSDACDLVRHHVAGSLLIILVVYLLSQPYTSLCTSTAVCRGVVQRVESSLHSKVCNLCGCPVTCASLSTVGALRQVQSGTLSSTEHTLSTLYVLRRVRYAPLSRPCVLRVVF